MGTVMNSYLDNNDLLDIRTECKAHDGRMIGMRHYDSVDNDDNHVLTSYSTQIALWNPVELTFEWLSTDLSDYTVTTLRGLNEWISHVTTSDLRFSTNDMREVAADGWKKFCLPGWTGAGEWCQTTQHINSIKFINTIERLTGCPIKSV